MAVLNIKNLPAPLYKKLQARARREHRSIAQEVTHLLTEVLETTKPFSILELKGLGKEHWQGIEAAKRGTFELHCVSGKDLRKKSRRPARA